jgi:hypothetical protein
MSLSVRRISLTNDRQEMLELLNRNFGGNQEMRFDWRHLDNPVGEAWCWFVYDQNKTTVATASVFPRQMLVDGRLVLCGQVGGFAVDAGHRSLGPAVLLQRTTFEPVNSGTLSFCYDCPPHDRGMSTFRRLGMNPNCEVTRYALPLRSDEFLEERIGSGAWTRPVIAVANVIVRMRVASRSMPGIEINRFDAAFDGEFSQLDKRVPSSGVIRASRSAELLNWRYRKNPGSNSQVWVARRAGELLGFVTFWTCGKRAYIVDLFGLELATTGIALLRAVIEVCRKEDVSSLHGFCSDDSELKSLFQRVGFRPRDRDARVVAYEKPSNGTRALLNHGLRWTFSHVELMV